LIRLERDDVTASQESAKLDLARGAYDLCGHRSCGDRNYARLQADSVSSPYVAVVALGSYEEAGVVDDGHAERRVVEW
jgi:hypothetical protein